MRTGNLLILICIILLILAGGANAITLSVCSSGCNHTSIQSAVNAANNGDTINVSAGTYNENVDITKSINLVGAGVDVTIINASNPNDHVVKISVHNVDISGFTVRGATGQFKAGVYLSSSDFSGIFNLNATNNDWGVYLASSNNTTLAGNTISDNDGYGINLAYSNYSVVSNNTLSYNFRGIYLKGSNYYNTITNNTFDSNSDGISLIDNYGNSIYHNNFINNTNQASDNGNNTWDNGYPSGGNYWSDFDEPAEGCSDANNDSICDSPYNISGGNNSDRYPVASLNGWLYIPPSISITSPKNMTFNTSFIDLNFTTNDLDGISWSGHSFDSGPNITANNVSIFPLSLHNIDDSILTTYSSGFSGDDVLTGTTDASWAGKWLVTDLSDIYGNDFIKLSNNFAINPNYVNNTEKYGIWFDATSDGDVGDAEDYPIYNDIYIVNRTINDITIKPVMRVGNASYLEKRIFTLKAQEYYVVDFDPAGANIYIVPVDNRTLLSKNTTPDMLNVAILIPGTDIKIGAYNVIYNSSSGIISVQFAIIEGGLVTQFKYRDDSITSPKLEIGIDQELLSDFYIVPTKIDVANQFLDLVIGKKTDKFRLDNGDTNVMGYAKAVVNNDSDWQDEFRLEDNPITIQKGKYAQMANTYTYAVYDADNRFDLVDDFLSQGQHHVTVYSNDTLGNMNSETVYFTIDLTHASITVFSPENTVYSTSSVELKYSIFDVSMITSINYSLDGGSNITLTENTTLYSLSNGSHTLMLHVKDEAGYVATSTIAFNIDIITVSNNTDVNTVFNSTTNLTARYSVGYTETFGNVSLDIVTAQNVNGTLNITVYDDTPTTPLNSSTGLSSGESAVRKYLGFNASSDLEGNLTWVMIRAYYTDDEISGLNENTLKIFRHCEATSTWQAITKQSTPYNLTCGAKNITVFDAGITRSASPAYVYANLSSLSIYGLGGSITSAASTSTSSGGGYSGLKKSTERVLVVANSVDSVLADSFLTYLEENGIKAAIINSTTFTEAEKVENRLIIVLGGPDALEGIGGIVSDLLSVEEEDICREESHKGVHVKYEPYTTRYSAKQRVIIVAGDTRIDTQKAGIAYQEEVKKTMLD